MVKRYTFLVELENGKQRRYSVLSKHLNGAIRKLYQEREFERIVNFAY